MPVSLTIREEGFILTHQRSYKKEMDKCIKMYQNMLKYAEIRKRMEKRAPFDTRIQPPSFAKVGVCRHKATGKWQRRGEKQSFDPWRSSSRRIIATIYGNRLTWLTFRFPVYGSKFQTLPGHGDTGAGFWRKSHTRINF